ncbi:hypothetical protein [Rheinheimera aquimaris]|uniref:hypothetical protein n=1 Tax=Rheinheimera aquimaris TaxID=412437 RepID=UPI003A972F53
MPALLNNKHIFAYLALLSVALLLIPFSAMQLTTEVNWSGADFLLLGALLFISSSCFVLLARKVSPSSRPWVALSVLLAFLYCWAELAVGVIFNFGS